MQFKIKCTYQFLMCSVVQKQLLSFMNRISTNFHNSQNFGLKKLHLPQPNVKNLQVRLQKFGLRQTADIITVHQRERKNRKVGSVDMSELSISVLPIRRQSESVRPIRTRSDPKTVHELDQFVFQLLTCIFSYENSTTYEHF